MIATERPGCMQGSREARASAIATLERELTGVPALPVAVRQVVNSAAAGANRGDPFSGGDHDLEMISNRLGSTVVAAAATARFVDGLFFGGDPGRRRSIERGAFWRHAIEVAAASELIVRESGRPVDASAALMAGVLHDIGKAALQHIVPKSYRRIMGEWKRTGEPGHRVELRWLGIDHAEIGERLTRRWGLAEAVHEAIGRHHEGAEWGGAGDAPGDLTAVIQLADKLVHAARSRRPSSGTGERVAAIGRQLELDDGSIDRVHAQLAGRSEHLWGVLGPLLGPLSGVSAVGRMEGAWRPEEAGAERHDPARRWLEAWTDMSAAAPWSEGVAFAVRSIAERAGVLMGAVDLAVFAVVQSGGACFAWMQHNGRGESACFPTAMGVGGRDETERRASSPDGNWSIPTGVAAEVRRRFGQAFYRDLPRWMPLVCAARVVGGILAGRDLPEESGFPSSVEVMSAMQTGFGQWIDRAAVEEERRCERAKRRSRGEVEAEGFTRAVRSSAVEMVARMGGGAAHELNTPLAVISGRAQMLRTRTADPGIQTELGAIREQAQRCSVIVGDLIGYARPGKPEAALVMLKPWLEGLVRRWEERLSLPPASVRVYEMNPALSAWVDASQMTRVFDALVANALEASDSRRVRVEINSRSDASDECVVVTVEDAGCGMPPEVLVHACDPFFSHRAAGRGRGMGLAIAERLVTVNGGRMWLESGPGAGTMVYVQLPARAPRGA